MRYQKVLLPVLVFLFLSIAPAAPSQAQGGPDACPAIVETALTNVARVCDGLGRDEACYGNTRVDATFWLPREDTFFSAPGDSTALIDLQTIATAPLDMTTGQWGLALLNLQADLPETLPGQAVTFLLMGDATLSNAVTPEEVAGPVVPVQATTRVASNMRSRPTTAANVVISVPARTPVTLVGVNAARDWYEVLLEGGSHAWIYGELVTVPDFNLLTALPVTYSNTAIPQYGPMQAFYFTTGLGAPVCNEAPNALIVQSTELAEVTLNINELEIQIGSTVIFTTAALPGNTGRALVGTLVEGQMRTNVNGMPVNLTRPGQSLAVTLNEQGLVDRNSRLTRLRDELPGMMAQNACRTALMSGLFSLPGPDACSFTPRYYIPPPPPTAVPTPVGPQINFFADRTTIAVGECVNLGWDVENVREVYYQDMGVAGQGSRQECPEYNSTYTLRVVTQTGESLSRSITITVTGGYYINFVADRYTIFSSECVTISWDVEGVQAVYYEDLPVTGHESRQECPTETTTYSLMVLTTDEEQIMRTVTIRVN